MKRHFITAPRVRVDSGEKISFCSFSFSYSGASACESLKLDECIDPQRPVDDWQPDMTVIFRLVSSHFHTFRMVRGVGRVNSPNVYVRRCSTVDEDAGHLQAQTVGTGVDPGIAAGTQVGEGFLRT